MTLEMTTLDLSAPIQRKPARVCLNMIVKNEAVNLPRMLASVRDHIDCWAIVDTGSTDDTRGIIFRALKGIPGEMGSAPFVNFSQARNAALEHAEKSGLKYDYLMLVDADMELVVQDQDYRRKLTKGAYSVMQRAGSLSYSNVRLLKRNPEARYRGVTHEYIDVPGGHTEIELSSGLIEFIDHATGSNRPDKTSRDILLLQAGLEEEPENERYHYYLAQSLREARRYEEAAALFGKRASMPSFPEEAWAAKLNQSRCLRDLAHIAANAARGLQQQAQEAALEGAALGAAGKTDESAAAAAKAKDLAEGAEAETKRSGAFHREADAAYLDCYAMRPWRAEPLVDLANTMNNSGKQALAYVYAADAASIPWPKDDILFIEDYPYSRGARQELYIAAGYMRHSPAKFQRGFDVCEGFALSKGENHEGQGLARYNLSFFAPMLSEFAPSFRAGKTTFQPPDGFLATNPSLAWLGDRLYMLQRAVNYRIRPDGSYAIPDEHGGVVWTRNFLLGLRDDLTPETWNEVLPPADLPEPSGPRRFAGVEDSRLVAWNGELWCSSTILELTDEKLCQIVLARIGGVGLPPSGEPITMDAWRVMQPGPGPELAKPNRHEKNWMPYAEGDNLLFHYSLDPAVVVDSCGRTVSRTPHPSLALEHVRGGGGSIPFPGGRLCITHEVTVVGGRRRYLHRFALLNPAGIAVGLSRPFHLARHGAIEFACGIAWAPGSAVSLGLKEDFVDAADRVLISFGVEDGESWLGSLLASDVAAMLRQPADIIWSGR